MPRLCPKHLICTEAVEIPKRVVAVFFLKEHFKQFATLCERGSYDHVGCGAAPRCCCLFHLPFCDKTGDATRPIALGSALPFAVLGPRSWPCP